MAGEGGGRGGGEGGWGGEAGGAAPLTQRRSHRAAFARRLGDAHWTAVLQSQGGKRAPVGTRGRTLRILQAIDHCEPLINWTLSFVPFYRLGQSAKVI